MSDFDFFLAHWQSLPRESGCSAPRKSAFNPADIKGLLPSITLHERLGRYDMRCRLTGTAIDEMFGRNFTDVNLFDLYSQDDKEFFAGLHDDLLLTPCGVCATRSVLMPTGAHFNIAGIHLPLADDSGKPVFLLTLMGSKADYTPSDEKPGDSPIMALEKTIKYLDLGYGLPA